MFDTIFFDELRSLTEATIAPVTPPSVGLRPNVVDLYNEGRVSHDFLSRTQRFVRELNIQSHERYKFGSFRVYPQHITNFSKHKAFRKQLNVGFSAGEDSGKDMVRIGIGFRLNQNFKPDGCTDYWEFQQSVKANPGDFDSTFSALGNYGEQWDPSNDFAVITHLPLSSFIINDAPTYADAWRFYGRSLTWKSDSSILSNLTSFVAEVIRVFDIIVRSGYYR